MTNYPLGRHIEHDPRSWTFQAATSPTIRTVLWAHNGPVLDQGDVGGCTGFALADMLNTDTFSPVRDRNHNGAYLQDGDALAIYSKATHLDSIHGSWPPQDTGSSGLAAAKAGIALGYLSRYTHTFSIKQLIGALQLQPVIVGTQWTQKMFTPTKTGFVTPTGDVVGGHEYAILGYDTDKDFFTCLNSWGEGWGQTGRFKITYTNMAKLLRDSGDVTVPIGAP